MNAKLPHQPFHRAAGHIKAFAAHLVPDLAHPVDLEVLIPDTLHLSAQNLITLGAIRRTIRIAGNGQMFMRQVEGAIGKTRRIGSTPYSAR